MSKRKLLIVEDEVPIQKGLVDVFLYHGFAVSTAADGEEALVKYRAENPDLVLLDVMLPKRDGFSVCNEIRSADREQPIILLTAKTSDEDIIAGLTLGADDYIAKPFSVRQLVLRVEAVLRRSRKAAQEERELQIKDIVIDRANLTGSVRGKVAEFTRREIEILDYLMLHRDRPVSREELLSEVWGYERATNIETRTVDIHIAKLRKKIEDDPKEPRTLTTVRGEGYKLVAD
jgi:DNA-binding response OmpR family regulator